MKGMQTQRDRVHLVDRCFISGKLHTRRAKLHYAIHYCEHCSAALR